MLNNAFYTNVSQAGNSILHRGYENGKRVKQRIPFQPKLYSPSKNNKPTAFTTIQGKYLEEVSPGTIKECKEYIEMYNGVAGFEIYGNTGWIYQYISTLYPQFEQAEFDMAQIRVLDMDIETESENGFATIEDPSEQVCVITLRLGDEKWVMATRPFALPQDPKVHQAVFASEKDMLAEFLQLWKEIDCDVVTGWNVRFYDLPYLINRIGRIFNDENKAKQLSPWGYISAEKVFSRGQEKAAYKISGISILDYYELYRKYTFTQQESYALGHIAQIELGESKLDYSEYDNIRDFYTKNFQKFVEYNVQDVDIVRKLDVKLNLINLHISMAYLAKVNYDDVFGQVRTWDSIIFNHLLAKGVIIQQKVNQSKDAQYAGAYVKDPIIGMHEWVVSYDLASLYPHLIMGQNISPDTIIDDPAVKFNDLSVAKLLNEEIDTSVLKQHDYSMAANGQMFRRDKMGFLPELMGKFYESRVAAKKHATDLKKQKEKETDKNVIKQLEQEIAKYDTQQMAFKIALNSAYGAIGNNYFRHYDVRQAEAITLTGQLSIQWIQKKLNEKLNAILKTNNADYVIASDTDSVYLNLSHLVKTAGADVTDKTKIVNFLDRFCKTILDPFINDQYQKLASYMNAYAQKMEMKREVIADRGIWTAKKRYCLNVYDSEGVRYAQPKLKIMGIEVQRSSTPKICRESLKQCVKLILTSDETALVDYIDTFKKKFFTSKPEDVAFPRGVNGLEEYADPVKIFRKSTPIAVRGALLYNHLLRKFKMTKTHTLIGDGEKVKFLYLREPNITGGNIISFPNRLPKQFALDNMVDYNSQFEKTFLDPLDGILKVIGWNHEKKIKLDDFFS